MQSTKRVFVMSFVISFTVSLVVVVLSSFVVLVVSSSFVVLVVLLEDCLEVEVGDEVEEDVEDKEVG